MRDFIGSNLDALIAGNIETITVAVTEHIEIKIIEFDHTDVVRHPLVSKIIRAYQKKSTDDKS